MKKKKLVTVIITTYKRPKMLERAIDSVIDQSYKDIEIIVVDDNDCDTEYRKYTEEIMKKYICNKKVKYIKHEKNKNGSAARNTGIYNSSGKYICFLDDDNYFYKTKIEEQLKYLLENKQFKACYCGMRIGEKVVLPLKEGNLMYEQLIGKNIIDTNMIMIEAEEIKKFRGWDERLKRNQDVSFMIRYFENGGKIGVVSKELVYIDLKDRGNEANGIENEKNVEKFLNYYDKQIKYCENKYRNARKEIYSSRYRSVLLNYLKQKDIKLAFRVYLKMLKIAPITFNKYLLDCFIKKIQKKPLYTYSK